MKLSNFIHLVPEPHRTQLLTTVVSGVLSVGDEELQKNVRQQLANGKTVSDVASTVLDELSQPNRVSNDAFSALVVCRQCGFLQHIGD